MNKASIIFLVLIVFGSLILSPLFIKNGIQGNLPLIFQALAQESTDSESADSADEEQEEETEEEKEEEETEEEKEEEETCDETQAETQAETEEEKEETCDETEVTEEEKEEEETDKETDKETEEETDKETTDAVTDSEEHTVLDEIINDESLLDKVISDDTTEAGLVSTLLVIKQEQNPSTTETCDNQADDDGDGTIDEADCVVPPTEICDNGIDDDADGKIDTADEEDCPIVKSTVVIESATDEQGKSLSPGDMVSPGEVTFTFSAKASETTLDTQENPQGDEFECALDDGSFNSCSSPETVTMEDGKHTFVVRLAS